MIGNRRQFLAGIGATAACTGLCGCGTVNPATGRTSFTGLTSVEDDATLGKEEHGKIVQEFGGEYENRRLQGYIDFIGRNLARYAEFQQFQYRFTILNTPVVNAFALPGGYVYVTRGLLALASNEAELAGVMAHEIGHVNARHTAERMAAAQVSQLGLLAGAVGAAVLGLPGEVLQLGQSVAVAAIQSYSRSQELEADTLGIRYMSRAGYDPDGMATFLSTLREQSMVEAQRRRLARRRPASPATPISTTSTACCSATTPRTASCAGGCSSIRACASSSACRKVSASSTARPRWLRRTTAARRSSSTPPASKAAGTWRPTCRTSGRPTRR